MTLNWATQVAADPKLVAVSVEAAALSHRLLREGRVFSLNILPRDRAGPGTQVREAARRRRAIPAQLAGFALRGRA